MVFTWFSHGFPMLLLWFSHARSISAFVAQEVPPGLRGNGQGAQGQDVLELLWGPQDSEVAYYNNCWLYGRSTAR